jgi:YjbE family integral membrane protein
LDLGILGEIHFTWEFLSALLSIVFIDLVLAGDNAVIIAMAVRGLPATQRKKGIIFGAGAAVLLRVICTFVTAQLLRIQYVKLGGGAVIIWIAVKLLMEGAHEENLKQEAKTIWQAVWVIVVADITMSIDNMLAVGGASKGNLFLLLFGLGLSIPLVVFTSNLLSLLMDKYPIIIYIGAAVLGRVGGEMMITDPFIIGLLDPSKPVEYGVEIFFTVGVIILARFLVRRKVARLEKEVASSPGAEVSHSKQEGA